MASEPARFDKPPPGEEALPRDLAMAWRHEKSSRLAFQERAAEADRAAETFQERLLASQAEAAGLKAELAGAEREARHQHRLGYLEGSRRFGVFALIAGMVLTFAIGEVNARLELWRQQRAVEAAAASATDAFTQGLAVGDVRAKGDDSGVARGREPASAPRERGR